MIVLGALFACPCRPLSRNLERQKTSLSQASCRWLGYSTAMEVPMIRKANGRAALAKPHPTAPRMGAYCMPAGYPYQSKEALCPNRVQDPVDKTSTDTQVRPTR